MAALSSMFGETQTELHPRCSRDTVAGCFMAAFDQSRPRTTLWPVVLPKRAGDRPPRIRGHIEGNRIVGSVSPRNAAVSFKFEVTIQEEPDGVCVRMSLRPRWEPHVVIGLAAIVLFAAEGIFRFTVLPKGLLGDYGMLAIAAVVGINLPVGCAMGAEQADDIVRAVALGRFDGEDLSLGAR
jgi:hypothetical protein